MTTSYTDRFSGSVRADLGKAPCDAATTVNITLSGYQTIDGVALNEDYMRCLVKNQTDATQNGIYIVFSAQWVRAADFSGPNGTVNGQLVIVTGGTQSGFWQLTTANPVQIDQSGGQSTPASDITFQQGILTSSVVSSAMQPVTLATTLALARTAMGVAASGANADITSLTGTILGDNAASGEIGEYITAISAPATSGLTSGTIANITFLDVPAGDWDIFGSIEIDPAGSTTLLYADGGISLASVTLPSAPYRITLFNAQSAYAPSLAPAASIIPLRVNVTTTTRIYLTVRANFSVSTCGASGFLRARRIR